MHDRTWYGPWQFDSAGRTTDINTAFISLSLLIIGGGIITALTWLCIYAVDNFGTGGLCALVVGFALLWALGVVVSYRAAKRRWKVAQVRNTMNGAR